MNSFPGSSVSDATHAGTPHGTIVECPIGVAIAYASMSVHGDYDGSFICTLFLTVLKQISITIV